MTLRIIKPGPLSLIQDLGRFGYQSIGVTSGGPMDEHAFLWANRLLGNENNAAQIEVTIGQFRCEFTEPTIIAITGADMKVQLNDKPIETWQTYRVYPGDNLVLRGASLGMRTYLAVLGGFQVTKRLNSSSTVVRDGLGGMSGEGLQLQVNDIIHYLSSEHQLTNEQLANQQSAKHSSGKPLSVKCQVNKRVPFQFIPVYSQSVVLDVIPSYQYEDFPPEQRARFFDSTYTLTAHMDRMGYRLTGEAIHCQNTTLISEGIALGAIQIPADGQPIVLLKDRQTIGGYPKMGCITAKGINQLAQCQPGSKIRFQIIDIDQAENERVLEQQFFNGYLGLAKTEK